MSISTYTRFQGDILNDSVSVFDSRKVLANDNDWFLFGKALSKRNDRIEPLNDTSWVYERIVISK
jgi:hypothetical protein